MDLYPGRAMPEFAGGDHLGVWSHEPDNATIRRRKVAGKDTIGDIKVTFFVPKGLKPGSKVTILGQEEHKKVHKLKDLNTCIICTPVLNPKDMVNKIRNF